jgi:hypothetical protein
MKLGKNLKKRLMLEVDAIHEHLEDECGHVVFLLNALKLDVESLHIRLDRAEACVGEPDEPDEPDEPLPDKLQAQVSRKLAEFNKRLEDTLPEYGTKLVATRLAVGELGRKLDDLTMRLDRAEPYWGAKVNPTEPLPDESCQEEIPWEGMPCLYGKKLDIVRTMIHEIEDTGHIVCCVITRGGDAACATATSTKDKPEHASDLHDAAFWGARYVLTARARHRSVSDKRDKRL